MAKKPGPKPALAAIPSGPAPTRSETITIKCRPEFKAWFTKLARSQRTTPSDLADRAFVMFGRFHGAGEPPQR
jgi:hypothetical protein